MTISHGARKGTLPKVWILLLSVFILTGLAACSQKPKPEKNTLVIGLESSPTNLDPRYATDANSCRLTQILFNTLFKMDTNFNAVPDVVATWGNPNTNRTTYMLRLPSGWQG